MKNRQTLSAVLLTALIAALAYVGISRGPVARQASPAALALGQSPTTPPARLAKPPAVALPVPVPVAANDPFPFRLKNTDAPIGELVRNETAVLLRNAFIDTALGSGLAIPAEFKTTGDSADVRRSGARPGHGGVPAAHRGERRQNHFVHSQ